MRPCTFEPVLLNAYVDGELVPPGELDVRRHLDVCPACRSAVETLLALKQAVAASVEVRPVPHTLRERLGTGPRPSKRLPARRLLALGVVAATALVAVGLWRVVRTGPAAGGNRVLEALVADHLHFLQVQDAVEFASDDPARVTAWFGDKLPFPIRVPAFRNGTLLGGRLCSLWGHKVALAFYQVRGKRVSLFVVNPAAVPAPDDPRFGCSAGLGDYRVCFVPTDPTLLALVADEDQTAALLPELQALAGPLR